MPRAYSLDGRRLPSAQSQSDNLRPGQVIFSLCRTRPAQQPDRGRAGKQRSPAAPRALSYLRIRPLVPQQYPAGRECAERVAPLPMSVREATPGIVITPPAAEGPEAKHPGNRVPRGLQGWSSPN
jgi:hypothetical protein